MKYKGFALAALAVSSAGAQAAVVWDNGAIGVPTSICSSSGSGYCGGSGKWTIFDDFHLSGRTTVTGLRFADSVFAGSGLADYVSTTWSIYAGNPFSTSPIASGTVAADLSFDAGIVWSTISGLDLTLNPGAYYFGSTTTLHRSALWTRVAADGNGLPGFKQSDGQWFFFDYTKATYAYAEDTAFQVIGAPVPEPQTYALMIGGLLFLGRARGSMKRKG